MTGPLLALYRLPGFYYWASTGTRRLRSTGELYSCGTAHQYWLCSGKLLAYENAGGNLKIDEKSLKCFQVAFTLSINHHTTACRPNIIIYNFENINFIPTFLLILKPTIITVLVSVLVISTGLLRHFYMHGEPQPFST